MQAAGELVVFVREFTARVQAAEDQLHGGNALFRVNIHRHAAPVVDNFQRLVGVKDHVDASGMPRQRFIDAVINNFLAQMVGTGGVGIHPRTAAHRLKPGEHLNGIGIIGLGHDFIVRSQNGIVALALTQAKEIDNLGEIIFKACKSVVAAGFHRLTARRVVRHRLAVIQHFVARLL